MEIPKATYNGRTCLACFAVIVAVINHCPAGYSFSALLSNDDPFPYFYIGHALGFSHC